MFKLDWNYQRQKTPPTVRRSTKRASLSCPWPRSCRFMLVFFRAVHKNRGGFTPQIIPCLIGFGTIIFTIHFGGFTPNFGNTHLGGGNSNIFLFSPRKLGKMNPIWRAYFSKGLKPPTSYHYIHSRFIYRYRWIARFFIYIADQFISYIFMLDKIDTCLMVQDISRRFTAFMWLIAWFMCGLLDQLANRPAKVHTLLSWQQLLVA